MRNHFSRIIRRYIISCIDTGHECFSGWTRFLENYRLLSWRMSAYEEEALVDGKYMQHITLELITRFKAPKDEKNKAIWHINIYGHDKYDICYCGLTR